MLDIGTELAKRYRIDSWLGRGSLGNIYLAEDLEQHRWVAVKELRHDLAADPTFMWGLRHEAQVLNQTPEAGRLTPDGVVEADQGAYVVMGYAPGMGIQELEDRWPRTGYFARSWDNAPATGADEVAPLAEPSVDTRAPGTGLGGIVAGGATSALSAAAAEPAGDTNEARHVPAAGGKATTANSPAQASAAPPGEAGGSAAAGIGAGQTTLPPYVPRAYEPWQAQPAGRASWPIPSSTSIGVFLLTVLVVALAIVAWLRGPGLPGQDPAVQAAPGVLAAATDTPSVSATPAATGAPDVALVPSLSSSATPSQTPTQPAASAPTPPLEPATDTPPAEASPTPADAYALIQAPANLHGGPGPNYAVVTVLQPGDQAAITGQSQDGGWWQVRTADGQTGWLFTSLVTVKGQVDQVPVVVSATATTGAGTEIPADTPAPTATSTPAATLSATTASKVLGACPTAPAGPFAQLPAGQDRLGCPSGGLSSTDFAHQEFQHGQILYRHDLRTIYVLYTDGTWNAFHDNYVEGQPFQLQQLKPPNGLKQPIKGIDRIWEQPEVRARLGWATRDEASVIKGPAQAFTRGQAMWLNRPGYLTAYFVLFADGTWAEYH